MTIYETSQIKTEIIKLIYSYRRETVGDDSNKMTLCTALEPKQIVEEAQQIFDWVMKK